MCIRDRQGDDPVLIDEPGGHRKAGSGPHRSQGDVSGENGKDQESPPHHQGNAPVDHDGDGAAGQDALAPLEVEHAGEHVAQQAEQARPVLGKDQNDGLLAPEAAVPISGHQDARPHCGHRPVSYTHLDVYKRQSASSFRR